MMKFTVEELIEGQTNWTKEEVALWPASAAEIIEELRQALEKVYYGEIEVYIRQPVN